RYFDVTGVQTCALPILTHPFLLGPKPRAFAHRGWHIDDLDGMENSRSAFRRAVEEGYRYIETDVRATADGVAVVHHDATLNRTRSEERRVGKACIDIST